MTILPSLLLRRVLAADALISGVSALAMSLAGLPLSVLLALRVPLLIGAGVLLLPYAVLVGVLAALQRVPRLLVWAVIAANVLWALGCAALLIEGAVQPTLLGVAFVVAQAVMVLVIAELQFIGLRRSQQAGAAWAAA
jgi:hypothetical protein